MTDTEEPPTPQAQPIVQRGLATANDVWDAIPPDWEECEISIGTSIGDAVRVNRISLHEDSAGRRVIVLHEDTLKVKVR